MKHLTDIVNEAMLIGPTTSDDNVHVIALVSKEHVDDNLSLMKGRNHVCLIWTPEDCSGYMCANGGVKWDDGKHWSILKNLDRIIGKVDWKKVDDINVDYAYWGQIGDRGGYDIEVYSASVPVKDVMKVYKQNGLSLWIRKHSPATAKLSSIFKKWKSKGWLS
jgi:hypothetical protein